MSPFGPYYPFVLDVVMRHAERMSELLTLRERIAVPGSPDHAWLVGRAAELRCVASVVGRDWHDGKLSPGGAAVELAKYLRQTHDGLARHLRLDRPSCCRTDFVPLAFTRPQSARDVRSRPASGE